MKLKLFFHTLLAFEAMVVIIQLALKQEAWFAMMCFWAIAVIDNLQDIFNKWRMKY